MSGYVNFDNVPGIIPRTTSANRPRRISAAYNTPPPPDTQVDGSENGTPGADSIESDQAPTKSTRVKKPSKTKAKAKAKAKARKEVKKTEEEKDDDDFLPTDGTVQDGAKAGKVGRALRSSDKIISGSLSDSKKSASLNAHTLDGASSTSATDLGSQAKSTTGKTAPKTKNSLVRDSEIPGNEHFAKRTRASTRFAQQNMGKMDNLETPKGKVPHCKAFTGELTFQDPAPVSNTNLGNLYLESLVNDPNNVPLAGPEGSYLAHVAGKLLSGDPVVFDNHPSPATYADMPYSNVRDDVDHYKDALWQPTMKHPNPYPNYTAEANLRHGDPPMIKSYARSEPIEKANAPPSLGQKMARALKAWDEKEKANSKAAVEGPVYWFGYSCDMAKSFFNSTVQDGIFIGLATLSDYKWQLNASGHPTILPSKGDVVIGSVYRCPKSELSLDRQPRGFVVAELEVMMGAGDWRLESGEHAEKCFKAPALYKVGTYPVKAWTWEGIPPITVASFDEADITAAATLLELSGWSPAAADAEARRARAELDATKAVHTDPKVKIHPGVITGMQRARAAAFLEGMPQKYIEEFLNEDVIPFSK